MFFLRNRIVLGTVGICVVGLLACSQAGQSKNNDGPTYVKKDSANPELAAKIFGKDYTMADLEKISPDIFSARMELYESQKRAVDEQVRQSVLEEMAKKDKLSPDAFVKRESEAAKKKVGDKDVNAFLKERNVGDPDKVPANLKDQVRGLIHMQNLVESYTKKNAVELYLKRPKAPTLAFATEGASSWGNPDAKVTIVEYSDFECPFCSKGKDRLNELKKEYGKKKIHVIFKHFPLPNHPNARPASEASLCVQEQDMEKFWKFHDIVFENQREMGADKLKEYAKRVGVDFKKFEECVNSKKYAARVEADIEEGRKFGVNSTPSFYVNSQPIRGARDISEFKELIDEALESK